MKSEPYPKTIKLSHKSEDLSSDVDDPSQSENELEIITSSEEEKEGDRIQKENNDSNSFYREGDNFTSHPVESISANFFLEDLTPDDEILTFQCPENFDVNTLLNQDLDLNNVTTIKTSGAQFKCQVLENDNEILTCIFPSRQKNAALVKIPVSGHILIKKSIKLPQKNVEILEVDRVEKMQMKDSVSRHPLLGRNWNDHLRIARKQIKKQKKELRKSMEHKKSLVQAEKERKEEKKKLREQLSLLKKTLSTEF